MVDQSEDPYFTEVGAYAMALHARFANSYDPNQHVEFDSGGVSEIVRHFMDQKEVDLNGDRLMNPESSIYLVDAVGPGMHSITPRTADYLIDRFEGDYPEVAEEFQDWYRLSHTEEALTDNKADGVSAMG